MVTPTDIKPFTLTVSNFGPIAEAEVELRPLTVFVGPSNTGKSYLATLIYALHRFFGTYATTPGAERTFAQDVYDTVKRPSRSVDLSEQDIDRIYGWASRMLPLQQSDDQRSSVQYELPSDVIDMVRLVMSRFGQYSGVLDDEIKRCFGIDQMRRLTRYASPGRLGFSLRTSATNVLRFDGPSNPEIVAGRQDANITSCIPDDVPLTVGQETRDASYRISQMLGDNVKTDCAHAILGRVAEDVVSGIFSHLTYPAHYLVADRAGVMHAHQVVLRSLIAGASRVAPYHDRPTPVLSGVLGDFLEQLHVMALRPIPQPLEGNKTLAERLEQRLIRGDIDVERSRFDYPSFVYRPSGWEQIIPLMNTSSMVSELAPVVLYLRHVVQLGDTLIIEEPESHLHPEAQVEFTRVLAAAVKAGIRVIITTHSEWVLEELANLVKLSELPPERRNDIDPDDLALSPDEVGAWLFEPNGGDGGSAVREIPLAEETGTFPSGFGLISEALYNRWVRITNRIERGG